MTLRPLATTHGAQIARTLLGVDRLPDGLESLLAHKTEGNPFFVEQVIRSLLEAGTIRRVGNRCALAGLTEDSSVPGTVLDVIAARIDRLEEAQKTTLQLASVVGREFTPRLLARLEADRSERLDVRLRELVAIELTYRQNLEPATYSYKNELTRDVAYYSLLTGIRRDLHRQIGEAIEELEAHRLIERSEALAHHFERGEVWDKALTYLAHAGQKAQQAGALTEALDFHERALAVCERLGTAVDPATHMSIHARKGEAHVLRSEFPLSVEAWRQVHDIAHRSGDRESEARALYKMGFGHHWAHDFDEALQCSERARVLASEIGSKSTVAASTFVTGWVHAVLGELDEAMRHLDDALRTSREAECWRTSGSSRSRRPPLSCTALHSPSSMKALPGARTGFSTVAVYRSPVPATRLKAGWPSCWETKRPLAAWRRFSSGRNKPRGAGCSGTGSRETVSTWWIRARCRW